MGNGTNSVKPGPLLDIAQQAEMAGCVPHHLDVAVHDKMSADTGSWAVSDVDQVRRPSCG
jgi:hypothetical protein